jgi:hypothetical protein
LPRVLPKFELEMMFLWVKTGDQFKPDLGQTFSTPPFLLLTDKLTKVQKPHFWGFSEALLKPLFL